MLTRRSALSMAAAPLVAQQSRTRRNVVFVLTDDHRYDAMGFLKGQEWLETPHLDSLARDGAHLQNAFVTTALCSPSRATILTGTYAHRHKIVDNNTPIPRGTRFFPELLRKAGYKTGFFGKWHMGGVDDSPQAGFDQWVSFKGQGTYLPSADGINVNGKKVPQKGYITDELTDYALDWAGALRKDQPFFMYLSHKAVHADFVPAARHKGKYAGKKFQPPQTQDPAAVRNAPMWVRNQRNSWHGVDYPYHSSLDIEDYYRQYAETLCGVDESLGRVLDFLRQRGQLDSTLIVYMGDNGFAFGEHGLIDKRTAYEESMRVPMLARCPELFGGGKTVKEVVANLDIMPTVLEAAGVSAPAGLDGASFLPLLQGKQTKWRNEFLYEYYWERNFPQTPTVHALRGDRYKYIHFHGIWDIDELYDLERDPLETTNLIDSAEHREIVRTMNRRLFEILSGTGGMQISLYPDSGAQMSLRNPDKPGNAAFPSGLVRKPVRPR
ncbi:MAG: sulfatase [Bryobacteraceae bacterium]